MNLRRLNLADLPDDVLRLLRRRIDLQLTRNAKAAHGRRNPQRERARARARIAQDACRRAIKSAGWGCDHKGSLKRLSYHGLPAHSLARGLQRTLTWEQLHTLARLTGVPHTDLMLFD